MRHFWTNKKPVLGRLGQGTYFVPAVACPFKACNSVTLHEHLGICKDRKTPKRQDRRISCVREHLILLIDEQNIRDISSVMHSKLGDLSKILYELRLVGGIPWR